MLQSMSVPRAALRSDVLRYGLAFVVIAVATLLLLWLSALLLPALFIIYLAAVLICAWYGGLGPGIVATLLAALTCAFFFLMPRQASLDADPGVWLRLAMLVGVGLLTSALAEQRLRALLATHAQRQQLHVMLDSIGDAVIATDDDSLITFINPMAEQLTGWARSEALRQPVSKVLEIVAADGQPFDDGAPGQALARGTPTLVLRNSMLRSRKGGLRPIDATSTPLRDPDGDLRGAVLVFRDISERVEIEAAREARLELERMTRTEIEAAAARTSRLYAVTAALSGALTPKDVATVMLEHGGAALGADGGAVAVLAAEEQQIELLATAGYPAVFIDDIRYFELDAPLPLADVIRARAPLLIASRAEALERYPHLAKVHPQIELHSWINMPLLLGERVIGALEFSFKTPRSLHSDEGAFLRAIAQQCAQALDRARLYQAEQQARTAAEAAVRVRDQFLSIAAHELRNPLTVVLGQSQLLAQMSAKNSEPNSRTQRQLLAIVSQTKRLNNMVGAMLDVSRIETGQLSIECAPINLGELVRQAVDESQPMLARHTISYTPPGQPIRVEGDEVRLHQVLQNLLSNAVKYSPEDTPILVEVVPDGQWALVHVIDKGIGIAPEALPNLFQRFYRAENATTSSARGLGIGLYVVREIIKLHGGTISVESELGKGSRFTIRLPRKSPD